MKDPKWLSNSRKYSGKLERAAVVFHVSKCEVFRVSE